MSKAQIKVLFGVLFAGPLLVPLFMASGIELMIDLGLFAHHLLSHFVCPTPAMSYNILGFPMGVCARCWGATIGLWAGWLWVHYIRYQSTSRAIIAVAAMVVLGSLLWVLEIRLWSHAPLGILLLNGIFAGFWAGWLSSMLATIKLAKVDAEA